MRARRPARIVMMTAATKGAAMGDVIRVWGDGNKGLWTPDGKVDVPTEYVEVQTGDAYLTREVKRRADVVYVRMKRDRRFSKAVALIAPKRAVADATAAALAS